MMCPRRPGSGMIDLVASLVGLYGMCRRVTKALMFLTVICAAGFVLDLILFCVCIAKFRSIYIGYFYPVMSHLRFVGALSGTADAGTWMLAAATLESRFLHTPFAASRGRRLQRFLPAICLSSPLSKGQHEMSVNV